MSTENGSRNGNPGGATSLLPEQMKHIEKLSRIGVALSAEKNIDRLLEMIVDEARDLTHADAGTLYIVDHSGTHLDFVILQNDTMNTRMGGTSGVEISLPPVSLYNDDGSPNHANVSSYAALTGEIVNIDDVYEAEGFDFTGPRKYDAATGYRSTSMLVIPMRNHENKIIGVLQLLNATGADGKEVIPFREEYVQLVASLASQAAVALTNTQLIKDLTALLYAFVQSIATAIDAKSPYTAGHINRVVDLTMLIADRIGAQKEGVYSDVAFSENELEELRLAAWMHDVGKITTPEHVVDKSTRLETIFDRSELIRTRFDLVEKDMEARALSERMALLEAGGADAAAKAEKRAEDCAQDIAALEEDKAFVLSCNNPGQFMDDDRLARLKAISERTYTINGEERPLLTGDELENLSIRKGSLTGRERHIIEDHARMTKEILSKLPFPQRLERVPEYAGGHHEKLDGSGYPNGLKGDELPLQARILAVADIFEALTAKDRPYKKPMGLAQAVKILGFMKKDNHIDGNILDLFLKSGAVMDYARRELNPEQVDVQSAEELVS